MISTKNHNLRKTILIALSAISIILVACFALEYPVQMLGRVFAAEKVYYISEVKIFQAEKEDDAIRQCESEGYTCAKKNLNAGTGKDAVFMGYKLTEDKFKALYDIKLLHMNGGYQIKNYAEANAQLEKSNMGTAETMLESANEFIYNYENGSPKAQEAYAGLNLFNIPESNNIGLGDYIIQEKADADFFAKVITHASSGAVSAITNFLTTGLTPLEKQKNEETGKEEDVSWADKIKDSALWSIIESDSTSQDELGEYDKDMADDAKSFFKQLQQFATDYENSQGSYDEDSYVSEAQNASIEETVEQATEVTEKDRSMAFVNAYEFLNQREAYEGMPLGQYLVSIGKKTSEEVDLRRLYPVLDPMSIAQRKMVGVSGLMPLLSNLGENKVNEEAQNVIEKAKAKLKELMGVESLSIWVNTDPEMADKKVAFTSDAIRLSAAQQLLDQKTDVEKWDDAKKTINDVLKWINVGSSVITVLTFLAGKFGIAGAIVALKSATALISTTVAAVASKAIAISAMVSSWAGIFSLVILAVTLIFFIVTLIIDAILKSKPKEYTEMADFAVDTRTVNGKDVNITYRAVKDNQGRIADLNGYKAQNGWVCMYTSDDQNAGSPIRADESGNVFTINYGDSNKANGCECVSYFGQVTPGNCNTGAKNDDVNGIYINYYTVNSLANRSGSANTGSGEQVSNGSKNYYSDMIVMSGKDPQSVKAKIVAKDGFRILDQNLCGNVRKDTYQTDNENQYTYIGYKITNDPKQAIRDIRVATFTPNSTVKFGQVSYGCAGTLGFPADNKDENKSYPADLDGLYYTKDSNAGTPIEEGKLHLVDSTSKAEAGWEPVTTFSGLLYNFATTRFSNSPGDMQGRQKIRAYSFTGYLTNKNNTWNNPKLFLYYEPEVKFTEGTKYLSGIFFGFGAHTEQGVGYYGAVKTDISELFNTLSGLPNTAEPSASNGVNMAQSYFYKGYIVDSNQKYLRMYYTWSYNPYRALTDVQALRGEPYISQLPYTIEKALTYPASAYAKPAQTTAAYTAASVVHQRAYDDRYAVRGIGSENAYMAPNGLMESAGDNEDTYEGFTREAQGSFKFSSDKMVLLPTNLYVSGYVKGRSPLTLDDVVVSTSKHDGSNNNGTLTCDVSGEKTLGGNNAEGDFFSVQDLKEPHSLTAFNISYPSWTDDGGNADKSDEDNGDHYHAAGTAVYMYVKHPVVKQKYISRIFVGASTRDDSKSKDKDTLKNYDKQVDLNAMMSAASAGSDEMICYDAAGDPTKAWYNSIKVGKDPETPKDGDPAAYISVARTDDADKAVKGILLYKSSAKNVPEQIQVDGAQYYCASNSTPIKMSDNNTYFVYYSFNQGTVPGKPITELDISDAVFLSGYATALVVDKADVTGTENGKTKILERSKPYGNANLEVFIHAKYEVTTSYFNKLFVASGDTEKKAQLELLEQGCTEFCDIDLNKGCGGKFVYLGYRGFSLNEDVINEKATAEAKEIEKQSQLQEAIYDIICTVGEEFHPEGIISDRYQIYYTPAAKLDNNKNYVPVDLNEGTTGPKIYMYYSTTYGAKNYNESVKLQEDPIFSSMPKDYLKSPLTKIGFARYDYVPYSQELAASTQGSDKQLTPWEYVMKSNNKEHAELNEGAVKFDSKHMLSDNRITMFAQRESGDVKASAEITGGYNSTIVTEHKLYLQQ